MLGENDDHGWKYLMTLVSAKLIISQKLEGYVSLV